MRGYKRALCIILLIFSCAVQNVSAEYNTDLEVSVPDSHTVSVEISGNGSIAVQGNIYKDGASISVARLQQAGYVITPDKGYEIGKLVYGDNDVTGQIADSVYTAPVISSDGSIRAVFNKMLTDCTLSPQANNNGYHTDNVTIRPPEGYSISIGNSGEWKESLVIESSTDVEVVLRSPAGGISEAISLGKINIDKTAPVVSGESGGIVVENNVWKSFINTITFGLIYKESKNVTIQADDPESGVDTYSYYVADKSLTMEQVKEITSWKDGSKFSISGSDADSKVIYARIVNKAGLILYISSDGMIFDTVAPKISGVDNGEMYYNDEPIDVKVTDAELASVTLNGESVKVKDNKAEFTVYPSEDDEEDYKIVAKDKAGNVKKVSFSVYETWTRDGITKSGKYTLNKNKKYKLGKGTWSVEGDNSIYSGNINFYVSDKKKYNITKS